jgi:hypothetical protein
VFDLFPVSLGVWVFCAVAMFFGAIVQRLAGQGFGMIATPMLAIVAPQLLPASILLVGVVIGFASSSIEVSAVEKKELPAGFAGRALGSVIAVWIATHMAQTGGFALLIAGMVYLGIALSLLGLRVAIRPISLFLAGIGSGIMGTLTAVGAPPMALLYQYEEPRRSAAMQNIFFTFGLFVSLGALGAVGLITRQHLLFAASLLPVVIIALYVAQPLAKHVAKSQIRPYALALAGTAATILLLKQIL